MIVRLVLLLALLAVPAWGAVEIEGSGSNWVDPSAPRTVSINCGSNPDRVLYAFIGSKEQHTISAVTFAGNDISSGLIVDIVDDFLSRAELNVWRVINPPSGSNTLSITMSLGDGGVMGGICFSGVDQGTPNGTISTDVTSTIPNTIAITVPANGYGVDFVTYQPEDAADHTVAAGQTIQAGMIYDTAVAGAWTSTRTATGNFTWDNISTTPVMSHAAFAVNPAAVGGGGGIVRRRPVIVQ